MSRQNHPPVVGWLLLGLRYLEVARYTECESLFARVVGAGDQLDARSIPPDLCIGHSEDEKDWPLGIVRAWGHLGIALSLAERQGDLRECDRHIASARECLATVGEQRYKNRLLAVSDNAEGLVLFRRGSTREAIRKLRSSIATSPNSRTYFHLALVLSEEAASEEDARPIRDEARRMLQHTFDLHPDSADRREVQEALALLAEGG